MEILFAMRLLQNG